MKANLKNRPKYNRVKDVGSPDWYVHNKDEEWFEAFEIGLREHFKQARVSANTLFKELELIEKEILGEET